MDKLRLWAVFKHIEFDLYEDYIILENSIYHDFTTIRDFCIELNSHYYTSYKNMVVLSFYMNALKVLDFVPKEVIKKQTTIRTEIIFDTKKYPDLLRNLLMFTEDTYPLVEEPKYIVRELGWLGDR